MEQKLETHANYRLASISNNSSNVFYAKISADFHSVNSTKLAATSLIYREALLSGAGKYSRKAYLDAVSSLGASIYVAVASNTCTFVLRSRKDQARKVIALFELILTKPTFAPAELRRIKQNVHNELSEMNEEARYIAHTTFQNELYEKTDRRHNPSISDLQQVIKKVSREDLLALHADILQAFWSVTVGTDVEAIAAFSKTLSKVKKQCELQQTEKKHATKHQSKHLILTNIPSKKNVEFSIGGILPLTIHHPDYIPFLFGLNVLGKWGGFSGRLMSIVREKEGLTYGIYARVETATGTEVGYWRIMTFFSPENAEKGLTATLREIKKIATEGITDDEYTRFKTILLTQQTLLLDSYVRSLDDLHGYISFGLSLEEITVIKARLQTVTKAEVEAALATYLNVATATVSGAGPIKKAPQSLSTFNPRK